MDVSPIDNACPASVWCVVGNIIDDHAFGPGGEETRSGTRLFRPNAKVYLASQKDSYAIFNERDAKCWSVEVIGQHRKSRQWIKSWIRVSYLTNWRIQVVYKPGALQRLWEADWPGFNLAESEFVYASDRNTRAAVVALLGAIESKSYRNKLCTQHTPTTRPWWRFW